MEKIINWFWFLTGIPYIIINIVLKCFNRTIGINFKRIFKSEFSLWRHCCNLD
jgi:hypothetical protein